MESREVSEGPKYPIAVIADDGLLEVYATFNSLVRDVEAPESSRMIVIDSCQRAFSLVIQGDEGLLGNLLKKLGAPERYRLVSFEGAVAADLVERARVALGF